MAAHLVVYDSSINVTMPADADSKDHWRYALAMSDPVAWRECVSPYMVGLKGVGVGVGALGAGASAGASAGAVGASGTGAGAVGTVEEGKHPYGHPLAIAYRAAALGLVPDANDDSDEDGANVCDIDFSLAFGGKILLHNTRLRLGRGRRYGIMGKNGAGKTTLLTNIGNGNIEGMPSHLKMVYVQHDDRSEDHGWPLLDEIMTGKDIIQAGVSRPEVEGALREINFTDEMLSSPRSCLSGGWKMKVLIIRAMLVRADILLLDEPTNHLDHQSVSWLTNYLKGAKDITCMIVSHDIPFLDHVITDVIHYENKKLVYYHGNMTHFVAIHPEAQYYYELAGSTLQFKFPIPERLDGVNSTTRAVLKMENISYTYPGATKPQLKDVNVKLCLASRVAVLGVNGAGKSTLIRLLVQETEPDEGSGEVWKHHNLRLAYVAQHSFHHIEEHLDHSPVDYIKWRFGSGVDKEDLARPSMKLTDEEEAADKTRQKQYGDVDKVVGRRKNGRSLEYECTWIGQGEKSVDPRRRNSAKMIEENKYIPLEEMVTLGLIKLVQQCDAKIAAANAGLDLRPLIISEIQGHLDDFALDAEFGTHGSIRRMSGGQKVKLVLAAAMWNKPHLLVLDEPTNYLDREALGALTQAIKNFHGGVIIISHNAEFTDALCTEQWIVKDGLVYVEGEAEEKALKADAAATNKIRKNKSTNTLDSDSTATGAGGNTNKEKKSEAFPLNPRTLEVLSKKEARYLSRCAETAGMTLAAYVGTINCKSPEWAMLGSFQKN
jgi:elongation factor 3